MDCPKAMFSKLKQRALIKIEAVHGRNVREWHAGLEEASGNEILPYRTVPRWVAEF